MLHLLRPRLKFPRNSIFSTSKTANPIPSNRMSSSSRRLFLPAVCCLSQYVIDWPQSHSHTQPTGCQYWFRFIPAHFIPSRFIKEEKAKAAEGWSTPTQEAIGFLPVIGKKSTLTKSSQNIGRRSKTLHEMCAQKMWNTNSQSGGRPHPPLIPQPLTRAVCELNFLVSPMGRTAG